MKETSLPPLSLICERIEQYYGFSPTDVHPLVGYDTQNYRIDTADRSYILKIHEVQLGTLAALEAETAMMQTLSENNNAFPHPIPTIDGIHVSTWKTEGESTKAFRLLSYLDGHFLAEVEHSPKLLSALGEFLANMHRALGDAQWTGIVSKHSAWDLKHTLECRLLLPVIGSADTRKWVAHFLSQFERHVQPHLSLLRQSTIHGDANDWNVLVSNETICGLIDFGDAVYSATVFDLAIALSYIVLDKAEPLQAASQVLSAYHLHKPLEDRELSLLYYLIAARWCISMCHGAKAQSESPDNTYISIHQPAIKCAIEKWLHYSPTYVERVFRRAVGKPVNL